MADIPKDVLEAATGVVTSLGIGGTANPNPDGFTIRDAIARAILAERERFSRQVRALDWQAGYNAGMADAAAEACR